MPAPPAPDEFGTNYWHIPDEQVATNEGQFVQWWADPVGPGNRIPPDLEGLGVPWLPQKRPNTVNLSSIAGAWSQQQVIYAQSVLAARGKLTGDYWVGHFDTKTKAAMQEAFMEANWYNMTLAEYFTLSKAELKELTEGGDGGGSLGGGGGGPTTTTGTTTSINLSGPAEARSVLSSVMAQYLGRAPTRTEIDQFLKNLNRRERRNPSVTDYTTTTEGTHTDTTTTTKGGSVDATGLAEDFVGENRPAEQHRFQTGQYFDVLANMLGM